MIDSQNPVKATYLGTKEVASSSLVELVAEIIFSNVKG